ncbi:mediator of RNA polymerase II transcription subunit 33A isoform X2 [Dendrobium catenatum]|uniref:Mediator of RNA polymerase II transcription subunit 33A n=1 Tax=Dendrobium catenatum TaxID=906689 RepID=A0A2I0VU16_9ASPA|nr:mediator of RNA polymerase II transcription subunit 33A isoform X2 [Dendrobium catenatum]PKU66907.1 Mediator of RNA polymerase II transcription subunit 33A [Dendrobium catenatum]
MDPAGATSGDLESRFMAAFKASEERGDVPLARAMEVARCVGAGEGPNSELGQIIVSALCFENNTPSLWKLLDQAIAVRLLSPLHIIALLTARVIPHRRAQPEAYRLYLELLSRYGVALSLRDFGSSRDKITKSIDDALQLSHAYGIEKIDFSYMIVFCVLTIIIRLMDGILEDFGMQFAFSDKDANKSGTETFQDMDIDPVGNSIDKRKGHREQLHRCNILMTLEVVEKITADKKNKAFLRHIYLNMPEKFNSLLERLQLIEVHKSTLQSLISGNYIWAKLFANVHEVLDGEYKSNRFGLLGVLVDAGLSGPTFNYCLGNDRSACWIPFDIIMENAMDGSHLYAISSVEILTELTNTLQVFNQASWQETFMALFVSALRLVQRDREPWEGPIPHLDARLCMLLSIVPLTIVAVVKEEVHNPYPRSSYEYDLGTNKLTPRRDGLISSLQLLESYTALLTPPPSVINAANNAASKAATFITNFRNGSSSLGISGQKKASSVKAVGNMLHLIVEACIARKLIDTSAYFWPGYVVPYATSKDSMLIQESSWSTFMEGGQLNGSLEKILITVPASSVAELEKLYDKALNGSEEEQRSAAKILCGASLLRGWNIQEHAVRLVVKLLSPPIPAEFSGSGNSSHLIGYMPMISAVLFGVCSVEAVHIISLYGMVPEVAAALMPLCEAFGTFPPQSIHRTSHVDETSIDSVFSCAFLFLLRLWKFYKPPQEHCIAVRGGTIRVESTLDSLLLMHNHRIAFQDSGSIVKSNSSTDSPKTLSGEPVYVDSFPKLRAWYFQNQACVASTLSGLCSKNPVHQVANKILDMICRKMTKGGPVSGNLSSTSSSNISESPVNCAEDACQRIFLPAWEVLEAVPFVLEAFLTACAYGRLSSRDLTTGLRDLVDFLPASLAVIISYFSAEITRGIWKPVAMNGIDWPSPAANLLSVQLEMKEILASAGVTLPNVYACGPVPMLPLPMAALVSLTITFKLDKNMEYAHAVIGQALENCSAGSPWPSMPIIGALWTQKVRRWHDFIVLSSSLSPFTCDKETIAQLIRCCFSSFLSGSNYHGVSSLLGHSISTGKNFPFTIGPGYLYVRSCRSFHDTHFVNNMILNLVVEWTHELAVGRACNSSTAARLLSSRSSLASAASAVRKAATLGATLLCIAGGPLLLQVLYEETLPAMLLSTGDSGGGATGPATAAARLLEGYAMAYMLVLSGSFIWGTGKTSPAYTSLFTTRRARSVGMHLEFVAGGVEGKISVGRDPVTWRAYVTSLVGLLVRYVPAWILEVRQQTLRKLAGGLRAWGESELAVAILQRGGTESLGLLVEFLM